MLISEWLKASIAKLISAGVETARLDCLVLLEDELNTSRTHLLAHPELELSDKNISVLNNHIARRCIHEPLAYIRGKTEFYGRDFIVSPAVLEPRPESEAMIELLLAWPELPPNPHIADVGTGSGALGITAQLEWPKAHVDLLEINDAAIEIAQKNVIKHTTNPKIIKSDLLTKSNKNYDILLCNLPYVPDDLKVNTAATHEPKLAIFGGPDGLDLYRKMFAQIRIFTKKPLLILCESLPLQHDDLTKLAVESGYIAAGGRDFTQAFTLRDKA